MELLLRLKANPNLCNNNWVFWAFDVAVAAVLTDGALNRAVITPWSVRLGMAEPPV